MADDDLAARVQGLPQEIFDAIYDLAFAVEGGETLIRPTSRRYPAGSLRAAYNDCAAYRFPVQLHLDRGTRNAFAREYYSTTYPKFIDHEHMSSWLQVIGPGMREMLTCIIYLTCLECLPTPTGGCGADESLKVALKDVYRKPGVRELAARVVLVECREGHWICNSGLT